MVAHLWTPKSCLLTTHALMYSRRTLTLTLTLTLTITLQVDAHRLLELLHLITQALLLARARLVGDEGWGRVGVRVRVGARVRVKVGATVGVEAGARVEVGLGLLASSLALVFPNLALLRGSICGLSKKSLGIAAPGERQV